MSAPPCGGFSNAPVVRNIGLYYPINFRFWVEKPCKTAKFSILLNVFRMSPVFVTAPFLVEKVLKTANSEKFVFSRQTAIGVSQPLDLLGFGRKQAPDAHSALDSVFSPEKQALSIAELVTTCHRFVTALFWTEKVRKSSRAPKDFVLHRVFRFSPKHDSLPRSSLVTRQPAELVAAFVAGSDAATCRTRSSPNTPICPNFATMKLALGLDVQTNAKGWKFMSIENSQRWCARLTWRCCESPASNTDLELWTEEEQGVIDNMIMFQKPFLGAARTDLESQLQRAVKVQDRLGALPLLAPGRQPRAAPAESLRRKGRALVEARHVSLSVICEI